MMAAGFTAWVCPRARHCHDAFGIVLEHRQGWKLVFSGDTQPSAALVRLGAGATVLIHECTFGDDRERDAAAKRHSTLGQALQVGEQMRAWRVLLTHFSQRFGGYAPALWHNGRPIGHCPAAERASPVFDGMLVPFPALHALPAVAKAMTGTVAVAPDVAATEE